MRAKKKKCSRELFIIFSTVACRIWQHYQWMFDKGTHYDDDGDYDLMSILFLICKMSYASYTPTRPAFTFCAQRQFYFAITFNNTIHHSHSNANQPNAILVSRKIQSSCMCVWVCECFANRST